MERSELSHTVCELPKAYSNSYASIRRWIAGVDNIVDLFSQEETPLLHTAIRASLQGDLCDSTSAFIARHTQRTEIGNKVKIDRPSWHQIKKHIEQVFLPAEEKVWARHRLMNITQEDKESPIRYCDRFIMLLEKVYGSNFKDDSIELIDVFCKGLRNHDMAKAAIRKNSLKAAIQLISSDDTAVVEARLGYNTEEPMEVDALQYKCHVNNNDRSTHSRSIPGQPQHRGQIKHTHNKTRPKCTFCFMNNHKVTQCLKKPKQENTNKPKIRSNSQNVGIYKTHDRPKYATFHKFNRSKVNRVNT